MERLNLMQSNYRQYFLVTMFFLLSATALPVQADSLKNILKTALVRDPVLLEARADEEGAYNRVEQAKSLHYPKLRLTGNSAVLEKHKNKSSYNDSFITPGLELSLNLYSFGAINAEVEKNEFTKRYYQYKYKEAREELGYTIGDLYLTAYDAKQSIKLLKKSLKRHKKILGDMKVIVDYDRGRRSEYVQAKARQILVVQQINDTQRLLDSSLSRLSKYTGKSISERSLQNPFKGLTRSLLKRRYTLTEKEKNPTFLAQQAELDSKAKDVEAEKAKQLPSIDLVGYATPDDQQVGLRFSWDVFNRSTKYTVKEKDNIKAAARSRLERVIRDIEESARLAIIEMKRSEVQLKTLKAHAKETSKVVEFYKLQFSIARRSLIEVLNAEKELTDVELAQSSTQTQWNRAALNYLKSQGKISEWVGLPDVSPKETQKNKVQFVDKKPNNTVDQLDKKLDEKIERETNQLLATDHIGDSNKSLSNAIKLSKLRDDKKLLKNEIAELDKEAKQIKRQMTDIKANKNIDKKATSQRLKKPIDNKVSKIDDDLFAEKGQGMTDKSLEEQVEKIKQPSEKPIEKKGFVSHLLDKVGLGKKTAKEQKVAKEETEKVKHKTVELSSLDDVEYPLEPNSDTVKDSDAVKEKIKVLLAKEDTTKQKKVKEKAVKEKISKGKVDKNKVASEIFSEKTTKKPIGEIVPPKSIITKRDDKVIHLVEPEKLAIVEQAIAVSTPKSLKKDTVKEKTIKSVTKEKQTKKSDSVLNLIADDLQGSPKQEKEAEKSLAKKEKPMVEKPRSKEEKHVKQQVKVAKVIKPIHTKPLEKEPSWEDSADENIIKRNDKPNAINLIDEVDSTEHFKD